MVVIEELTGAANRHALGLLMPEDMMSRADKALNAGHYSERSADLAAHAIERHPSQFEVEPIFVDWLQESGVPLPNAEEAT